MAAVRAAPLILTALALGVAVVLRTRRETRRRDAEVWADATDALSGDATRRDSP